MDIGEILGEQILKGESVLLTRSVIGPFEIVDVGEHNAWIVQTAHYLDEYLGSSHLYSEQWRRIGEKDAIGSTVEEGLSFLRIYQEDFSRGRLRKVASTSETIQKQMTELFDRFHTIARQLHRRHCKRATLEIVDEYDVQDLLHAILYLLFPDVRSEEWTPTYAGSPGRMDFLLKSNVMAIEVKKTRPSLTAKILGEELIVDIKKYQEHPWVKILFCFVYDPDGLLPNPRGLEMDLTKRHDNLDVVVLIRP